MPNFKITQQHPAPVDPNSDIFNAVWTIADLATAAHDGNGVYSYIGAGGNSEKDIASIRTVLPLDPSKNDGISSFEVTLLDTGKSNFHFRTKY